jgi:hypothetical protein
MKTEQQFMVPKVKGVQVALMKMTLEEIEFTKEG